MELHKTSMPNEFLFLSSTCAHNTYFRCAGDSRGSRGWDARLCPRARGTWCAGSRSSGAVLPDCTGTGCRDGGVGFGLFLSNILSLGMLNENIQSQTKGLMYFWLQQK